MGRWVETQDNFFISVKTIYVVLFLYEFLDLFRFKIFTVFFGKRNLKLCRFFTICRVRSLNEVLDVFFYVVSKI